MSEDNERPFVWLNPLEGEGEATYNVEDVDTINVRLVRDHEDSGDAAVFIEEVDDD